MLALDERDTECIDDIRDYIKSISGFQEVILLEYQINLGSTKSILLSYTRVFRNHDKLIF